MKILRWNYIVNEVLPIFTLTELNPSACVCVCVFGQGIDIRVLLGICQMNVSQYIFLWIDENYSRKWSQRIICLFFISAFTASQLVIITPWAQYPNNWQHIFNWTSQNDDIVISHAFWFPWILQYVNTNTHRDVCLNTHTHIDTFGGTLYYVFTHSSTILIQISLKTVFGESFIKWLGSCIQALDHQAESKASDAVV